ncbi:hypothetical protein [Actibacterium sp.]|uniref:hypothetical protein n=1 Tax=Actibacterium sp. TaxID=1872125 RepID=UPI00356AA795
MSLLPNPGLEFPYACGLCHPALPPPGWFGSSRPAGAQARTLSRQDIAAFVQPPFALGPAVNDKGVYSLLNSGGAEAGYVFETEPLAPLPGFSGAPINMLVTLDPI